MFYAQLNDDNICVGVSDLSGEVINEKLIKIENIDDELIGKKYDRDRCIFENIENSIN